MTNPEHSVRWVALLAALALSVAILLVVASRRPDPLTPITWVAIAPGAELTVYPWRAIVIHHSATSGGDVATFDRAHGARGWDGIGYHFVIGNGSGMTLGTVEPTFRWRLQREGAHAGVTTWNRESIGICLVGDFEQAPPQPFQEERLAELIATLITNIPTLSLRAIGGHKDIPGKATKCPGRHFDLERVRFLVRQRLEAAGKVR